MQVGLIDVDGHNFPNLPLMKLSAWHNYVNSKYIFYTIPSFTDYRAG